MAPPYLNISFNWTKFSIESHMKNRLAEHLYNLSHDLNMFPRCLAISLMFLVVKAVVVEKKFVHLLSF